MFVSVTQEDIDNGLKGNCYHCPVAKAIQRNYSYDKWVQVSHFLRVFSTKSTKELTYYLPSHVNRWIEKFDSGQEVKPFEFELDV